MVTAEIVQSPQDFYEKEAAERSLSAHAYVLCDYGINNNHCQKHTAAQSIIGNSLNNWSFTELAIH